MTRTEISICALIGFSVGAAISETITGKDVSTYLVGMLWGMYAERKLVGKAK